MHEEGYIPVFAIWHMSSPSFVSDVPASHLATDLKAAQALDNMLLRQRFSASELSVDISTSANAARALVMTYLRQQLAVSIPDETEHGQAANRNLLQSPDILAQAFANVAWAKILYQGLGFSLGYLLSTQAMLLVISRKTCGGSSYLLRAFDASKFPFS